MISAGIKKCQNCEQNFEVFPEDVEFYNKIEVPAPNLCPGCRFMRQSVFRNERTLYKRNCDLCKKSIISMYSPQSGYVVYCLTCYESDVWDPASYKMEYDQSRKFLPQFYELLKKVPKQSLYLTGVSSQLNSDYTNYAGPDDKNCYLIFNSGVCENVMYSRGLKECRDTLDAYFGTKLERCYETINVQQSSGVLYSQDSIGCLDSAFLMQCANCTNCFGCVNLRHKQYHFLNQPLTKEEYETKITKILGSRSAIENFKKAFSQMVKKHPRRENANARSVDVTGNYIVDSKSVKDSFEVASCEDCRYMFSTKNAKDSYDAIGYSFNSELLYNVVSVGYSQRIICSATCENCHDVSYSFAMRASENCFGCTGLKNASYSILNKKYSKEEYQNMVEIIKNELNQDEGYGTFFDPKEALFGYNEALGQDNLPLSKEAALQYGFKWREESEATQGKETLQSFEIPDNIKDVGEGFAKEILACEICRRNYFITNSELTFYKSLQIPIPSNCFNCRHTSRVERRGKMKLHEAKCSKCDKSIVTSIAELDVIIYCESCYQQEVL